MGSQALGLAYVLGCFKQRKNSTKKITLKSTATQVKVAATLAEKPTGNSLPPLRVLHWPKLVPLPGVLVSESQIPWSDEWMGRFDPGRVPAPAPASSLVLLTGAAAHEMLSQRAGTVLPGSAAGAPALQNQVPRAAKVP